MVFISFATWSNSPINKTELSFIIRTTHFDNKMSLLEFLGFVCVKDRVTQETASAKGSGSVFGGQIDFMLHYSAPLLEDRQELLDVWLHIWCMAQVNHTLLCSLSDISMTYL